MSDEEWTPADIGAQRIESSYAEAGASSEGWYFDRVLETEERRLVEDYLTRKHPGSVLSTGSIFFADFDSDAPTDLVAASPPERPVASHSSRKGATPRPMR